MKYILFILCFITLTLTLTQFFKFLENFHGDENREMVPMIAPGEQLIDYKKRVEKHMFGFDKIPLFDGEYIRDKFDKNW